jgi:NADPH:quinone reductase
MRAIVITDGEIDLRERPDPVAGVAQVVVRVHASGLNTADLNQIAGFYPAPPGWAPDIPGLEVAGVVEQVGEGVTGFAVGDRVMSLVGGGGHAERIAVPADLLLTVPDGLGWQAAGGFVEAFSTAWDALVPQAGVRAGDRVLVTGATGGVGLAMVQIALASGADVVASVRNTDLHAPLAELIASDRLTVVVPDDEAAAGPFDAIAELTGGARTIERLRFLALNATVMLIGMPSSDDDPVPAAHVLGALMATRSRLVGSTIRARSNAEKAVLARGIRDQVLPLLQRGLLTVHPDSTFPVARYAEAFDRMRGSGKLGKVVLTWD